MKNDKSSKEENAEDYCFICKDGGLLVICDHKNCFKAYHPSCISKDNSILESEKRWICARHSCSNCQKSSTFQCYCCPRSFCRACIRDADFVQVQSKSKGFCSNCLKLSILIEKDADADSDGEKVDFTDTATYEFLFKDYWEIVKEKEGLRLVNLNAAKARLETDRKTLSDLDNLPEEEMILGDDDTEDKFDEEVPSDDPEEKCHKRKMPLKRSRSKRKTFIGWGSEELRQFLSSIGKDTEEPLTQLDAFDIVKDYIYNSSLLDKKKKKKKKKVACDDKLYSLFRKKSLKLHKIYSLLESHLAANDDSQDDDSYFTSCGEDDLVVNKRQQRKISGSKIPKSEPDKKVLVPHKTCYAAIVDKNIRSVYLRRSLILKFLKDPDTFECKVIGCFVRVKNDPKDFYYSPKKIYQLGQVTGIKKTTQAYKLGDISTDIVLCVSTIFIDILISMLSDDDFEEEECEDLLQLVRKGHFKRPTVEDLEQKIRIVHEDITNHWIDKEIVKLQRQIDRANVNGWRRERLECIERRDHLCIPDERIRLLKEMPKVILDTEEEIKATSSQNDLHKDDTGLSNTHLKAPTKAVEGGISSAVEISAGKTEGGNVDHVEYPIDKSENVENGENGEYAIYEESPIEDLQGYDVESPIEDLECYDVESPIEDLEGCDMESPIEELEDFTENCNATDLRASAGHETEELTCREINTSRKEDIDDLKATNITGQIVEIDEDKKGGPDAVSEGDLMATNLTDQVEEGDKGGPDAVSEAETSKEDTNRVTSEAVPFEHQKLWSYIDPEGNEQGPFTLASLRYWQDEGFFDNDFKVWRSGQSRETAILLIDALCQHYPKA